MKKTSALLFTIALGAVAAPAHASYIFTIQQVGVDVIASGSGSFDLAGLTYVGMDNAGSGVNPVEAALVLGPASAYDRYTGISGPTSFGTGGVTLSTSNSGPFAGFSGFEGVIGVPLGYVSNSQLGTSSGVFANTTLASLGLTPGTYTYSFGSGRTADSFTVEISALPEPSTWAMMLVGFAAIGYAMRRRRTSTRFTWSPAGK